MAALQFYRRNLELPSGADNIMLPDGLGASTFVYVPTASAGIECQSGAEFTPSGATMDDAFFGPAITSNGSSTYASATISNSVAGTELTAILLIKPANTTQTAAAICGCGNSADNNQILYLTQSGAQMDFYSRDSAGAGYAQTGERASIDLGLTTDWQCIGLMVGSNTRWWRDGVEKTARSTGVPARSAINVDRFGVGAMVRGSPALYWAGSIGFAFLTDKALDPELIQYMTMDLSTFVRKKPVRFYSLPSGALTLNSLTMSNFTSSGARATLSITR